MTKEVRVNPAYIPLLTDTTEVLFVYGGSGSGKSYWAAQKIVLRTLTEMPHKFLVLRKVGATIKDSVFALLKEVISEFGVFDEFQINQTDKTFTHLPTGNQILCKGLDEPEKIKSVQGITGMWMEELTEFDYNDFTQLLLRIRGNHANYVQYLGTFNPISEYHWIKKKIADDLALRNEKYKIVKTTYNDNLSLSDTDIQRILDLKESNPLYYQIYCLGEWGIEDKTGKFAYSFIEEKHTGTAEDNKEEALYLAFDFNVNPITCQVIQYYNDTIYVLESLKLENSNIYQLCDVIKAKYGSDRLFLVTGDATGQNRSAMVKDNLNYYKIIMAELDIAGVQVKVPTVNPPIAENQVLVNLILERMNVVIDKEKAQPLIYELKYTEMDENKKIKKDRTSDRTLVDNLDGFRYYCNMFHRYLIKNPKHAN
jgi:phage terminase large subunit